MARRALIDLSMARDLATGGLSRLASFLGKGLESSGSSLQFISGAARRQYSAKLGTSELLLAYEVSPWLQSVVKRISWAAAVVEWQLWAVKPEPGTRDHKLGKSYIRPMALQQCSDMDVMSKNLDTLQEQGLAEQIHDHPLLEMLGTANPLMTGLNARFVSFAMLNTAGEVFWILSRNNAGAPIEFWPIPPSWVRKVPDVRNPDAKFEIMVSGKLFLFDAADVVWFKHPRLENPYTRGSGTGFSIGDELDTDEYISKFQNTFFTSRGRPDLLISVQGAEREELKLAKAKFEEEHRDMRRGGRTFWHPGEVKVTNLAQKLKDMDVTEQRKFFRDMVVSVYGAPPEVVGIIENSNRATIREALTILALLVTVPQLQFMRAELQSRVVPLYDDRLVLRAVSPVPSDRDFQLKAMEAAPEMSTRGEWRGVQGQKDRGDGDDIHLQPFSVIEVQAPKESKSATPRKALKAATKEFTAGDVQRVIDSLQPEALTDAMRPDEERTVDDFANDTLRDLGVEATFGLQNPQAISFMANWSSTRITRINRTTQEAMRAELTFGMELGEGVVKLAERVNSVMDTATKTRSITIARSEVIRASNFGTFMGHSIGGVDFRQWVPTLDAKTREEHLDLGAMQPVAIGQPFEIAGYFAMYPGDFGVAALDINCRCTSIAVITNPKSLAELGEVWKLYVTTARPYEERMKTAAIVGFEVQRTAALAELERLAI
ncbi:MAG: phage portal protein [Alphaproteobacteria bacterium]